MSGYNGWANYETWAVMLWIDNDQGSQEYWLEEAADYARTYRGNDILNAEQHSRYMLSDRLKGEFQDIMPEIEGMWADLLTSALDNVDWNEIAASLIEDAAEIMEAEENAE